ncbi:MAG: hypothetical protein K8R54_03950 [Bacteroidales bacterium]|nr:hypothetical protein [Bacteroidales bacterium]
MSEQNQFIKTKIKFYTLLWLLFVVELGIFFLITFLYLTPEVLQGSGNNGYMAVLYASYLITVVSIPAIYKIYDYRKKKVNKDESVKSKLEKYFFSVLIKYAVLETAAILSLAAFYLNEINEPLYMFGIVFVAVLLNKPSYSQFEKNFLIKDHDNVIEEIVYMPDEFGESEDDIKPESK